MIWDLNKRTENRETCQGHDASWFKSFVRLQMMVQLTTQKLIFSKKIQKEIQEIGKGKADLRQYESELHKTSTWLGPPQMALKKTNNPQLYDSYTT